jgi:hypothetical protein
MGDDAASIYAEWKCALPSRISHPISHLIPGQAVGRNGMNDRQISPGIFYISNGAILKPSGCADSAWARTGGNAFQTTTRRLAGLILGPKLAPEPTAFGCSTAMASELRAGHKRDTNCRCVL